MAMKKKKPDGKMITHREHERETKEQRSRVLLPEELPPCEGVVGVPCVHPVQPVLIAGYDDKYRCPACNKVHIALVEREAGESPPGWEPEFVSPRLDRKSRMREMLRSKRIKSLNEKLVVGRVNEDGVKVCGQKGGPVEISTGQSAHQYVSTSDGDFKDMKDAMSRDEHGTRAAGLTDKERRDRIVAKYSAPQGKGSMT